MAFILLHDVNKLTTISKFEQTTFDGASGPVTFDPVTGTRKFDMVGVLFHKRLY
jgi:hypothetical protein